MASDRRLRDRAGGAGQSRARALSGVWIERREELARSDSVVGFTERLEREWAIETVLIEWETAVSTARRLHGVARERFEEGGHETGRAQALGDEVFQINYREGPESVQRRFGDWMERVIERGLAMWESSI